MRTTTVRRSVSTPMAAPGTMRVRRSWRCREIAIDCGVSRPEATWGSSGW
ncbi:hypothetical protein ABH917_002604 [Thermobifida halotolerans]